MPVKNYTTKIPPSKTVGEIHSFLIEKVGAAMVQTETDNRQPKAILFALDTPIGRLFFRIEARHDKVQERLKREKKACTPEQAQRTAWRTVFDWVKVQVDMLESDLIPAHHLFLPYMVNNEGITIGQAFDDRPATFKALPKG